MRQYYYTDGTDKFGPFTLEELGEKEINRETRVWFQGLSEWIQAGEVEELKDIFSPVRPPGPGTREFSDILIRNNNTGRTELVTLNRWNEIIKYYGKNNYSIVSYFDEFGHKLIEDSPLIEKKKPPKTYLVESILVTLFCCLPFGIVSLVNAVSVESRLSAGNVSGAEEASKQAGKWVSRSVWVGIACYLVILLFNLILTISQYERSTP